MTKRILFIIALLTILIGGLIPCPSQAQNNDRKIKLMLKSSAFEHNSSIPEKYTCKGPNITPPLEWTMLPEGTKSFALIADDPDTPSGTWVHWVIYDIPAHTQKLAEGIPPQKILPTGAKQGTNDFPRIGYRGPCPPWGEHRYFFKLYALDTSTNLPAGVTKSMLLEAMKGHIIAEAQLMGKFKK
jgi:Raf kinase inhibitor-like YbhB/YbcL family protein